MEDKLAKEEEQLNAADRDGAAALKASDDRTRLVCDSSTAIRLPLTENARAGTREDEEQTIRRGE